MTKQDRVAIINQIMISIGSKDRRFFYSKKNNRYAYLSIAKSGKIYYHCEHSPDIPICMSVPETRKPKNWQHGGTLLSLVRDFCDFIRTGEDSNHNHGYGGLFCPHWGYEEESMKEIRQVAYELGYLKQPTLYRKETA